MEGRRIINLEGGIYNERVEGNYVQVSGNSVKTGNDSQPNQESPDIVEKISQLEGKNWQKNQVDAAKAGETHVIYGNMGVARYFVEEDGEVTYSRMHGTQAEKAQQVGFKVD
jgi:hypothetical protein